jgi:hypothetical protein
VSCQQPRGGLGRLPRRVATTLSAAALAVTAAGCVSMPNGGPVLPYAVSPSGNGQAQPYLQIVPQPPLPNASPSDIVRGFLAASASFVGQQHVAREYLTPDASRAWLPGWSATVYRRGPTVRKEVWRSVPQGANDKLSSTASARPSRTPSPTASSAKHADANTRVTVTVGGSVEAKLSNSGAYAGAYAVPSATPKGQTYTYDLVIYRGQWRISRAPNTLLLTHTEFDADYQLRNLYFFDPSGQHLIPDPVYVPLQATQEDLVNGLVQDLITQPGDWLASGATQTAFPKGTRQLGKVTVDGGIASVNLGGAFARAQTPVKEQVSAQLLWTLITGAGQGTQEVLAVELYVNGSPFAPPNAQGNPVQGTRSAPYVKYKPIDGSPGSDFYYIDSHGELLHDTGSTGQPVQVARIGTGYKSLAVSPDGQYLAVLRDGAVYTGAVGRGKLTLRDAGGGFTSLSWDHNDNLWAAGPMNVVMMPATSKPRAGPFPVVVAQNPGDTCPGSSGEYTALRVAPDGVRVALVIAGQEPTLAFGAIVTQDQPRAGQQQPLARVNLSPFFVCGSSPGALRSLSWYGTDNVVALGQDSVTLTLTEYPVDGGTPVPLPLPGKAGIQSITARKGPGLIAGVGDEIYSNASLTGAWNLVGTGLSPAYPG